MSSSPALCRRYPGLAELLPSGATPLDATTLPDAARRLAATFTVLPLPGAGNTLTRWQFLAAVAARDLSLAKVHEAHTDANAILAELSPEGRGKDIADTCSSITIYGVWAARSPRNEVRVTRCGGDQVSLHGTKSWCSGARFVTHALVTCTDAHGEDWLANVPMHQSGVAVNMRGWEAVGMAATQSVEVEFSDARATLVGGPGAYLRRPGFWHGGAGIAACWYGAAAALAERLRDAALHRDDPHLRAHLGATDVALVTARACLRECAAAIDAAPRADASKVALRARGAAEHAVESTLRACSRGMGAGPLCRDPWFARMCTDLPVFVRQSHAEADLAILAASVASAGEDWRL
ncbi:hypothetical protein C7401_124130 [Paraburkholderia unamae]|uniref:acyl-CoA dehydrogenase n=1 Tax=Paraburkholderia unamae TaxID=219649 RepID=UPI000DC5FE10|nr:acyl-CoA dehydrogenase [Paraburkholderia unamae]RAR54633.1 hypothetical protein C7401_124130 [Paraburkholderia unamae]